MGDAGRNAFEHHLATLANDLRYYDLPLGYPFVGAITMHVHEYLTPLCIFGPNCLQRERGRPFRFKGHFFLSPYIHFA